MSTPTTLTMPDHIGWQRVDSLLRDLGFAPHQVRELHITFGSTGHPLVMIKVEANNQTITRVYDAAAGHNGVRIAPNVPEATP